MSLNKQIVAWLDKTFYPEFQDNWDNFYFRELTLPYLDKDSTVILDLGAGRGALPQMNFRDLVKEAVGIDPEEAVHVNPYLHEAHVGFGDNMPFFTDGRFDVVVINNVLEHIKNANGFYAEVARITKSGGIVITKTPNLYHYMPLFSRFMPTSFHKWFNKMRGRPTEDTFPTQYEANTRTDQTRLAEANGFKVERFILREGRPEYLRFTFVTYLVGIVYERLINLLGLDTFKIVIFTVLRKS